MIKLNNKITRNVCKIVSTINDGDFFEYRGAIYQSFGYDNTEDSFICKNYSDGGLKNFDGEEEVYLLDVEVTILGYTKEE